MSCLEVWPLSFILVKEHKFFNLQSDMIKYNSQKDKYTNIVENELCVEKAVCDDKLMSRRK